MWFAAIPPLFVIHAEISNPIAPNATSPRLMFHASRIIGRATEAAMGLFFNTTLVSLADRVVAALDPRGDGFNGLHLRLERDARDWFDMVKGGQEVCV